MPEGLSASCVGRVSVGRVKTEDAASVGRSAAGAHRAIFAYAGGILAYGAAFLGRMVATRAVGAEEFGRYASSLAVFAFVAGLCQLAFHDGVARHVAVYRAKDESDRVVGTVYSALRVSVVLSLVAMLALLASSQVIGRWLFGTGTLTRDLWALWAALPFVVVGNILAATMIGLDRLDLKLLFIDVVRSGLFPVLVIFGMWPEGTALRLIWPFTGAAVVAALPLMACAWLILRPLGPATLVTGELVRYSLPLLGSGLLMSVANSGNPVLLGVLHSQKAVAFYALAWPLAALVPLGVAALEPTFLPAFATAYARRRPDDMRDVYRRMTRLGLFAAIPIATLLLLAPDVVLGLLFGEQYREASGALRVFALGMLLQVVTGPNDAALKIAGRPAEIMKVHVIGTAVGLGLVLLFAPSAGVVGVAFAWAIAANVTNVCFTWRLYHLTGLHPFDGKWARIVVGAGILVGLAIAGAPLASGSPAAAVALWLSGMAVLAVVLARFRQFSVQ